jgi:hypothetical protein
MNLSLINLPTNFSSPNTLLLHHGRKTIILYNITHTQNMGEHSSKDKMIQYQKFIIHIYVRTKNFQLKGVCKILKGKRAILDRNLKPECHNPTVELVTGTQQRIKNKKIEQLFLPSTRIKLKFHIIT